MEDLTGIIAILAVFGMPVLIVAVIHYFKYKTLQLRAMEAERGRRRGCRPAGEHLGATDSPWSCDHGLRLFAAVRGLDFSS